ncbi:MAG: hypothetical protein MR637_07795 [Clostridiales bacterium]|nr:hypothetical protein [Clostridiales bacterium]
MAFKQPRVPEYREREGADRYIRSLVLFLKDFCMDVWTANNQRTGEIDAVRGSYPVTSVCGKTGEVALTAEDVGALSANGTAENAGKLGGKTAAELMLTLYPVGSIYMSLETVSPAGLFGGTWEQLKDRFLLGAGGSYTAGQTGGASRTSITPGGYNKGTALTTSQMPAHAHGFKLNIQHGDGTVTTAESMTTGLQVGGRIRYSGSTYSVGGGQTHTHDFVGYAQDVSTMPPFLAVNMWRRVS